MTTKKRNRTPRPLAKQVRGRLEELRVERGQNYSQFAKAAGVPFPQYTAWRNDGVVPGGVYLKLMAERLGVTTDWLLGLQGAVKRRGQSLPDTDIEGEIGVYVRGALPEAVAAEPWGQHVTIQPVEDAGSLGRRVVTLGIYHLLNELRGQLNFLVQGEPVRLSAPFRALEYKMERRGRAGLQRALMANAPPFPGPSIRFGSDQDLARADAADQYRRKRRRKLGAVLAVVPGPTIIGTVGPATQDDGAPATLRRAERQSAKK